jgi:hypothetical protein
LCAAPEVQDVVQMVSNVAQALSNVVPAWRNRVRSHAEQTDDSEGEPAKLGSNGRNEGLCHIRGPCGHHVGVGLSKA